MGSGAGRVAGARGLGTGTHHRLVLWRLRRPAPARWMWAGETTARTAAHTSATASLPSVQLDVCFILKAVAQSEQLEKWFFDQRAAGAGLLGLTPGEVATFFS